MHQILEYNKAKKANNLEIDDWVLDNLHNLTLASEYQLNLKYDTVEKARLLSGILVKLAK